MRNEEERDNRIVSPFHSVTRSIDDSRQFYLKYEQFGKYEIGIVVDSENRYIGVVEVREKRDFLSTQQRISTRGAVDVDSFYKE